MNKLQAARQTAGLTQQQLADQTGISLSTIQKYERDAKDINSAKLLNLLKMTAALKCQLKDILTDEETLAMLEEPEKEQPVKNTLAGQKVYITDKESIYFDEWGTVVDFDGECYHVAIANGKSAVIFNRNQFKVPRNKTSKI